MKFDKCAFCGCHKEEPEIIYNRRNEQGKDRRLNLAKLEYAETERGIMPIYGWFDRREPKKQ